MLMRITWNFANVIVTVLVNLWCHDRAHRASGGMTWSASFTAGPVFAWAGEPSADLDELVPQLNVCSHPRTAASCGYLVFPGESGNVKQATWQLVSSPAILYLTWQLASPLKHERLHVPCATTCTVQSDGSFAILEEPCLWRGPRPTPLLPVRYLVVNWSASISKRFVRKIHGANEAL